MVAQAAETKKAEKLLPGDIVIERPGSDFMVDVIKTLGFEYVATNPGSSFRSLHESLVNYGGNTKPELLTCLHEESAVGMAHGYAKASGKPMAVMVHGTVGLQHAAMGIYNAWCDRVPVYIIAGNGLDANKRRPGTEWNHSVQDAALMVRDYVKWDDYPMSLQHFAESAVRAYKIATTPPCEPVMIVADIDLQEDAIHAEGLKIPKLAPRARRRETARRLPKPRSGWRMPRPGHHRRPHGARPARRARPARARRSAAGAGRGSRRPHELPHDALPLPQRPASRAGTRRRRGAVAGSRRSVGPVQHFQRSAQAAELGGKEGRQDHQHLDAGRLHPRQLPGLPAPAGRSAINGDAQTSLPLLTEEVKKIGNKGRRELKSCVPRTTRCASAREAAAVGWDTSPVTTARSAPSCGARSATSRGRSW